LNAGFLGEARKQCEKALAIPNYHKNIPQLMTRVNEASDEEQRKFDEALEKVKPKASFYRKAGEAAISQYPKTFHAKWQSPECTLDVVVEGTTVKMSGAYESPGSILAGIYSGGFFQPPATKNRIEYIGEIRGRAIFGTVSRTRDNPQPALVGLGDNKVKVLMYLGSDQCHLHVMENVRSQNPRFYALKMMS
jgi:hypothetical protein